jgi:hypothetical protein
VCHTYVGPKTFCKEWNAFNSKTNREELPASNASSSQDGSSGSEHGSDSDLEDWDDFQRLDVSNRKCDWVSHPHIIACLGEYNFDSSKYFPESKDPINKWGHQEFLLLRAVGQKDKSTYERVGRASTREQKRLPITEAKGWTWWTITLV